MKIIVPPHNKISRDITIESLHCHISDIKEMERMVDNNLFLNNQKGYALAHCQVSDDPYKIFVLKKDLFKDRIIINAEILNKENQYTAQEGCLSFPYRSKIKVKRFEKVTVRYFNIDMKENIVELDGIIGEIFQHEIQHFTGRNIYMK